MRESEKGDTAEVDELDFSDATSTFGDRLTSAREAMGMDQAQLARRLGVKLQTVVNWESDRSEPRANRLQMLAGMLNVSMVWLIAGQGRKPDTSDSEPLSNAGACLAELHSLQIEQARLAERMARLKERLRGELG